MEELVNAILFDTRSIQRYIYGGNRLKTNIGASYLVDRVFSEELVPVLEEMLSKDAVDTEAWRTGLNAERLKKPGQCVLASNGGGSALVLFSRDIPRDRLIGIVQNFTQDLLVKRPGLHVGAAHGTIRLGEENFQRDLGELYKRLKENQNRIFPLVNVPYPGLTVSCQVNGETANFYDSDGKIRYDAGYEQRFYSQEVAVKAMAAEKATDALRKKYPDISSRYDFPMQIEELGQKEGENYFSIIHIDGNNMGQKFRACSTQAERSLLSDNVRRKTEGCFGKLLELIERECESYRDFLDLGCNEKGKPFLPIRPIILGGDDVTFVCPAKLALPYAKAFMEFMMDPGSVQGIDAEAAKTVDCCAGIAILKTTYPFFRGYELAEQLCDSAKRKMRGLLAEEKGAGTSWMDFAILHGEQAPTLEQIRAQEYTGARGNMHFGPYQVGHTAGTFPKEHRYDVENLLEAVRQFRQGRNSRPGEGCMANNKIKELRLVIQHGKHDAQKFLAQLSHIGQALPEIDEWAVYAEPTNALWSGSKTPYVDAIEMMDFLPTQIKEAAPDEN